MKITDLLPEAALIAGVQTQPNPAAQTFSMLGMFLIMGIMFYFLAIRPQQKKAREHAELLKTLKPGDKVQTSGGLVGIVVAVKEKTVSLRSADSKLEVVKSAVADVLERAGAEAKS